MNIQDILEIKKTLQIGNKNYSYMSLKELESKGYKNLASMPYSIKVLLENVLRQAYNLIKIIESVVWGMAESRAIKIKNNISRVLKRAPDFFKALSFNSLITL